MIRFRCATCHEKLSVPESAAGRKGKCPKCGEVNRVPSLERAARPGEIPFPPRAKTRPDADAPVNPARPPAASITPAAQAAPVSPTVTPVSPTMASSVTWSQPAAPDAPTPIPARNQGAELERPERWTRGPLKLEVEEEAPRGWFGRRKRTKPEEEEYVLGQRPKWQVDQRETPMAVKVALLVLGVAALIGVVWGFFYLVLKLVIAVSD